VPSDEALGHGPVCRIGEQRELSVGPGLELGQVAVPAGQGSVFDQEGADVLDGLGRGKSVECVVREVDGLVCDRSEKPIDVRLPNPGQSTVWSWHLTQRAGQGSERVGDLASGTGQGLAYLFLEHASPASTVAVEFVLGAAFKAVDVERDAAAEPAGAPLGRNAWDDSLVAADDTGAAVTLCCHVAIRADSPFWPDGGRGVCLVASSARRVQIWLRGLAGTAHVFSSVMIRARTGRASFEMSMTGASLTVSLRGAVST
jgi:hypothetical protein